MDIMQPTIWKFWCCEAFLFLEKQEFGPKATLSSHEKNTVKHIVVAALIGASV